jgi:hypothetical protein
MTELTEQDHTEAQRHGDKEVLFKLRSPWLHVILLRDLRILR